MEIIERIVRAPHPERGNTPMPEQQKLHYGDQVRVTIDGTVGLAKANGNVRIQYPTELGPAEIELATEGTDAVKVELIAAHPDRDMDRAAALLEEKTEALVAEMCGTGRTPDNFPREIHGMVGGRLGELAALFGPATASMNAAILRVGARRWRDEVETDPWLGDNQFAHKGGGCTGEVIDLADDSGDSDGYCSCFNLIWGLTSAVLQNANPTPRQN